MNKFTKSILEEAVLDDLSALGWQVAFGPEVVPGESAAECDDYRDAPVWKHPN